MRYVLATLGSSASVVVDFLRTTRPEDALHAMARCLRMALIRPAPILLNARRHKELLSILSAPHTAFLLKRHPRIAYKYVGGNYLARCFSASQRLDILIHHYSRCAALAAPCLLKDIVDGQLTLWRDSREDHEFAIHLRFPYSLHHPGRPVDHEGDMLLVFDIDGAPAYVICFTICPLHLLNEQRDASCFFVGRVQGVAGRFETIRKATKLLHEVSPRDMLMAALQGLGKALCIDTIAGVGNQEQLSTWRRLENDSMDYDHLWSEMGARATPRGQYLLPLPLPEKPIELVAQRHRGRTLRKRHFKQKVAHMAEFVFCERYGKNRQEENNAAARQAAPAGTSPLAEAFA